MQYFLFSYILNIEILDEQAINNIYLLLYLNSIHYLKVDLVSTLQSKISNISSSTYELNLYISSNQLT